MTLTAPALLPPERLPMPSSTTSLPPAFDDFVDADRFAELRAMQDDLHARAAALVPLVADVVEADTAICSQLAEVADRARVLFVDDHDPQARAFDALLSAVGSDQTSRILRTIHDAINGSGPVALDTLTALEEELARP